jgi:hypothetical protein
VARLLAQPRLQDLASASAENKQKCLVTAHPGCTRRGKRGMAAGWMNPRRVCLQRRRTIRLQARKRRSRTGHGEAGPEQCSIGDDLVRGEAWRRTAGAERGRWSRKELGAEARLSEAARTAGVRRCYRCRRRPRPPVLDAGRRRQRGMARGRLGRTRWCHRSFSRRRGCPWPEEVELEAGGYVQRRAAPAARERGCPCRPRGSWRR